MKTKLILGIVVVAVAVALTLGPSALAGMSETPQSADPGETASSSNAAETVYSVRVESAVRKTLQSYIEVNGDVVAETKVDVVPDAAGKLVSLKVEVGSVVKKGQLIAEVDPSKPGTAYSLSPVYAPISGTVTSAPLSVGATVSTSTTVAAVGVMDKLQVEADIPERDVGQIKAGLSAKITLEAFPGERFPAYVGRVSPVLDADSRSKKIILKFRAEDSRINAGMFARIKLDTVSYADRVAVPEEAVTAIRGSSYVYVLNADNSVSRREVAAGVTVDGLTEIVKGIAAGETIVTQGQQLLSDGVKVRAVNAAGSKA